MQLGVRNAGADPLEIRPVEDLENIPGTPLVDLEWQVREQNQDQEMVAPVSSPTAAAVSNIDEDIYMGLDLGLDVDGSLTRELLQPPPRGLLTVNAELLFLDGQFVFHYREKASHSQPATLDGRGAEHYKFLSPDQVAAAFRDQPVDTGWLPQGVLRWGSNRYGTWMVKFIPPMIHRLVLTALDNRPVHGVKTSENTEVIEVPLPGLIFAGIDKTYYVWAVKEKTLKPDAQVFHAPLPNVYQDGRICFGQNHPPAISWEVIDQVWKLFIEQAPFNADLSSGKSMQHARDIRIQLLKLAATEELSAPAAPPAVEGQVEPTSDLAGAPVQAKSKGKKKGSSKQSQGREEGYPLRDLVPFEKSNTKMTVETLVAKVLVLKDAR